MLPKYHILSGLLLALALFLFYDISYLQALIVFLAAFLIDIDHYLLYVIKKNDGSIKNSMKFFYAKSKEWLKMSIEERKKYKRSIFIFHGIECWALMYLLYPIFPWMIFIGYGFALHMALDYIDLFIKREPLIVKFSQLYVYLTNKKKKEFF
ncbi:hypothetical protein J4456_05105 [Candidatus Pacearchaeota archaeon]|nr:hypothetical protein [Candidatus Pacearchaeota archaeon]